MIWFLFAGDNCYPFGGAGDFKGVFTTKEDAKAAFVPRYGRWAHVVRFDGNEFIVKSSEHWQDEGSDTFPRKPGWFSGLEESE